MKLLIDSGILTDAFSAVLNMSVTASVVIGFVLLARAVISKAPKIFSYALWAVVLFRLLCPVTVSAEFSLLRFVDIPVIKLGAQSGYSELDESQQDYILMDPTYPVAEQSSQIQPDNRLSGQIRPDNKLSNQIQTDDGQNAQLFQSGDGKNRVSQVKTWLTNHTVAAMIWIAGMVGLSGYHLVSYRKLRPGLREAILLRDNIYMADGISTAFVTGLLRPRIYLPSTLSEHEMDYIILHEQTHIRRADHIAKILAFAALCVHWFNPLVWVAFILAGKDMEMSCDEAVVKRLGTDIRADYSASLLRITTGRRSVVGMPLAFGEGSTRGRINRLANWKNHKTWVLVTVGIACALLAVGLLAEPERAEAAEPFGKIWRACEVMYGNPEGSFSVGEWDSALYLFGEDRTVNVFGDNLVEDAENTDAHMGQAKEITLSQENFDRYFREGENRWFSDSDLSASLRRNNERAWLWMNEIAVQHKLSKCPVYCLLEQKNGDLYLLFGYYDLAEMDDKASDDSYVEWMIRLEHRQVLNGDWLRENGTLVENIYGESDSDHAWIVNGAGAGDYLHSKLVYAEGTYKNWTAAAVLDLEPGRSACIADRVVVPEDGASLEYHAAYDRMGLNLQVALVAEDGTEYLHEFTDGFMSGGFMDIPAGRYQVIVRNSEANLKYKDTATETLTISTVIFKYRITDGEEVEIQKTTAASGGEWPSVMMTENLPELTAGKIVYYEASTGVCSIGCYEITEAEYFAYIELLESEGFRQDAHITKYITDDYVCYRTELSGLGKNVELEYRGDETLEMTITVNMTDTKQGIGPSEG